MLSPLTLDLEAIDTLIEESVRSGLIPDGTALGLAMAESVDLLRDSQASSRIVVALTDGENNVPGVSTQQAAAVARALGVRMYTIGLPPRATGSPNVSLDELALIYAADETGGRYFRATDTAELAAAYEEIAELERRRVGEETLLRSRELAPWLLLAAARFDHARSRGPRRPLATDSMMPFGSPSILAALAAAPLALALLWLLWRRRRLHLLAVRGRGGGALLRGSRRGGRPACGAAGRSCWSCSRWPRRVRSSGPTSRRSSSNRSASSLCSTSRRACRPATSGPAASTRP